MTPLTTDLSDIKDFDHQTVSKLADHFDVDYLSNDLDQYQQWFQNLSTVAQQNLGLAHCILHNQSARNLIAIAAQYHDHGDFHRDYSSQIGAYGVYNPVADSIVLTNTYLKGRKCWASQLHTADFIVLRVMDPDQHKHFVFLDPQQVDCDVLDNNFDSIGMKIAKASDLIIDANIPKHWILDHQSPNQELLQATNNFHKYGLITNYWSVSQALLNQIQNLCVRHKCQADFDIQKLELQVDVLRVLWEKNMPSLLEPFNQSFWLTRDTQYNFGKKTLIDVVHLFMQIANSRLCDSHSLESRMFRDSIVFSSHIENLYKNIQTNNANRDLWQ